MTKQIVYVRTAKISQDAIKRLQALKHIKVLIVLTEGAAK